MADLISRAAAIAEIDEYIEEYSELEPETGYHNLKWCAMEEAKDVLSMLPTVDAIPVEWFYTMKYACGMQGQIGACAALNWVLGEWKATKDEWQKEQEAR